MPVNCFVHRLVHGEMVCATVAVTAAVAAAVVEKPKVAKRHSFFFHFGVLFCFVSWSAHGVRAVPKYTGHCAAVNFPGGFLRFPFFAFHLGCRSVASASLPSALLMLVVEVVVVVACKEQSTVTPPKQKHKMQRGNSKCQLWNPCAYSHRVAANAL